MTDEDLEFKRFNLRALKENLPESSERLKNAIMAIFLELRHFMCLSPSLEERREILFATLELLDVSFNDSPFDRNSKENPRIFVKEIESDFQNRNKIPK